MKHEYEAVFLEIDRDEIIARLAFLGAEKTKENTLQKRCVFDRPDNDKSAWLRVRDEGDKITMTHKIVSEETIYGKKEIEFCVTDFEAAVEFLCEVGCKKRSYQESYREMWKLDETEICIDEWPHLEPYIEIEGESEAAVQDMAKKLGLDYDKAIFVTADKIYAEKYGVDPEVILNMDKLTFEKETLSKILSQEN